LRYLKHAFGHVIQSDFSLNVLLDAEAQRPDILVRKSFGIIRDRHDADPCFDITPDRQYFHWREVGAFEIRDETTIHVEAHAGVKDDLLAQPLLGIVISCLLERRGTLCLHGGAVKVGDRVAVLLGHKGAGKSTSVAALLAAGYPLLSDDLAAITFAEGDDIPIVQAGFPSLKLWPDSMGALSIDADVATSTIHPSIDKLQKEIGLERFAGATKLGGLFFLDRKNVSKTVVEELPAQEALRGMLIHASISRLGLARMGPQKMSGFMERVGRVARMTKAYRLVVQDDFGATGELVRVVSGALR
jgi:hypothetical protein